MPESEKQEGQKTVVAFIAGLLIGGLLVWVFSSSPEAPQDAMDTKTDSISLDAQTETAKPSDAVSTVETNVKPKETPVVTAAPRPTITADRDGSVTVGDQTAGNVVELTNVTTPAATGWIVVRDYEAGVVGRILGAARFNEGEGLNPSEVNLLRATEAGKTYQVVFYSDNGDKVFDLNDDAEIIGISASFKVK